MLRNVTVKSFKDDFLHGNCAFHTFPTRLQVQQKLQAMDVEKLGHGTNFRRRHSVHDLLAIRRHLDPKPIQAGSLVAISSSGDKEDVMVGVWIIGESFVRNSVSRLGPRLKSS